MDRVSGEFCPSESFPIHGSCSPPGRQPQSVLPGEVLRGGATLTLHAKPSAAIHHLDSIAVYTFLSVIQVIMSVVLIFLILLHSGKDAGLSGAFGIGGGGSSLGGGSMVERNLDRATVFFAVLWVINTFILLKI